MPNDLPHPSIEPNLPSVPQRQPLLDLPTFFLLVLMYVTFVVSVAGGMSGFLPWWGAVLISSVGFQITFSVWHEAIHGTMSRLHWVNTLVGTLGALPSFIPYRMMWMLHIHHHRYTNDPEKDLDHWLFQAGPFWQLIFRYPEGMRRARKMFQETHPKSFHVWSDRIQQMLVIGGLGALVLGGYWQVALWSWVVPKILSVYVHGWCVNYLPHHNMRTNWYQQTRCFPFFWLTILTIGQNYHAVHHLWPRFRWYEYGKVFRRTESFLRQQGVIIHRSLFDSDVYEEFSQNRSS